MSIPEEVSKLRNLASSQDIPLEGLAKAQKSLEILGRKLSLIIGARSVHATDIYGLIGAAELSIEEAMETGRNLASALLDAADYHAK